MKNMRYINMNKLRIGKFAFVTALLSFAAVPTMAQDEVQPEETEATPARKAKKPQKKYPMMEIKGLVVDAATGEPLAGAQLQAFNNGNYTAMTDEDGTYTISVPVFVTSITANLDGYSMVQTSINGRSEGVNFSLRSAVYGSDYNSKQSASKSVVAENMKNSTAISVDQEIQNRLGADVRSVLRSGIPGLGASMFINGLNSLNANAQPLIIVDGVVFDMLYDKEMLHTGYFNNLLAGISLDDIESVEVLKNGTAIYGAKAANGVILVNTKRSKSMATRIDVNLSAGVEIRPSHMDLMDASSYRSYASEMIGSTGTRLEDFKFLSNDRSRYYYNTYHNNTDWSKEVYREAWTQNYGISIQGGDDIAAYNLSVGYMNSNATLKQNDLERFNIRFNTDIKLNKWFSTRFDASYTNLNRDLRNDGWSSDYASVPSSSPSTLALLKAPFLSPYAYDLNGNLTEFVSTADDYLLEMLGKNVSLANPTAILKDGEAKNKNHMDNTMINIAVTPKWQPTKNFYLQERFSYTMQTYDESYYTPISGMPSYTVDGNEAEVKNSKYSLYSKHNAIFSDTRANWAIPLGAHRLDVFGGFRFMNDTYTSSYLRGDNTGNDKTPNNSMAQNSKRLQGEDINWRSLAYYANIDYNFRETYYLQASLSMETSSRFGKKGSAGVGMAGVRWGMFPSVQAAWVMTNEKWFKPSRGINMLKLNVGFESVGNDGLKNDATLTYMSAASLLGQGFTSIGLTQIGNQELAWETTNRLTAGLEGNFLNNRLNVKFNYFYSQTNDLLTYRSLPYVSGLVNGWANDGSLRNQGVDFAFNAKVVDNRKFKFQLGASIGHYKNKIISLAEGKDHIDTQILGGTIRTQVGSAAGLFYGYKTAGVFATSAEAAQANLSYIDDAGTPHAFRAGDMKFVDVDNNNIINENDMMVIGDPNPDIFGNIHANFFFGKRWSVSATFNYSLGNDIYNFQRQMLESGSAFQNQTTALNRRWIAEGQKTDIPRISYGDAAGNSRFSDRWVEDGSYLKLKNISVNYKIPVQNEYIQGISVWASANNLFTITRYLGADPELSCGNGVLYQGIDAGFLSAGRSFTLGVKINL